MSESIDLSQLQQAVQSAAAIRSRCKLQPAGGAGDKVFPPTYANAVYATEKRRVEGSESPVDCVLLDSVQSQANRMEESLQQAIDQGRLKIPVIEVDFTPFYPGDKKAEELRLVDPVGKVTSLEAPHRIADAILRDSVVVEDNKPFRASKESLESIYGQRLRRVSNQNATVLFELCPTALIFGMWDSTGPKGGLGAKFERAMVSEIIGVGIPEGWDKSRNRGLRQDQLGIRREASVVGTRMDWDIAESEKTKGAIRPSEIVHGSIPFENANCGLTIDHALQTTVISIAALRRLRFPIDGKYSNQADQAARAVLVALALCAASLADESGLDLRSRCVLYGEEPLKWSLLDRKHPKDFSLTGDESIALLQAAVDAAKKAGLPWREEPLVLQPSDKLVKLVVKSQLLAIQKGVEE